MSSEIAIKVSHLSKCFEIYDKPRDRLLQMLARGRKKYYREFWALNEVSFDVKKGETIGIIGRNGSGKSTLLQMICGTLNPTSGHIHLNGRVAALLELGSGFNPEFTGRENIYMNASVLGLSKEKINARFEDIVAFADIGDFIKQPVKTYSSGMVVRLAFAVIAHVDADILIVDEALAVGDVFYQQKCMRYLRAFQSNGGTVIFVSHDTSAVINLCDRAILLSHRTGAVVGKTDDICKQYIENIYAERDFEPPIMPNEAINLPTNHLTNPFMAGGKGTPLTGGDQPENLIRISPFRHEAESFGHGGIKITEVWFEDNTGSKIVTIHGGEPVNMYINVESFQNIQRPTFGFMLKDRLGQYIIAEGTDLAFRQHALSLNKGDTAQVKFSFSMPILLQGDYSINVAVAEGLGHDHVQHHWINDAMILHSLKCRLIHGICGLKNLSMAIHINTKDKD